MLNPLISNDMSYTYNYIMEYLPKRYSATMKQESDRQVIYDFKNGYCSLSLMNTIVESKKNWVATTGEYASYQHPPTTRQLAATKSSQPSSRRKQELPATTIPSCLSRTRNQTTSQARRQTRQRTSTSRQATLPAKTSSS